MEIDRDNFWEKLPTMLKTISEAHYVAVDLEMSGIFVNKFQSIPVPIQPALRTTYRDARTAANRYTILQFGFTCISWEPEQKSYVTKTFNVPLHPGVTGDDPNSKEFRNVVDRCFRLSTKTLAFFEKSKFSLQDVFHKGVSYLSAGEYARKETSNFMTGQGSTEDPIDVDGLPISSFQFRKDVKDKIIEEKRRQDLGLLPRPIRVQSSHGHRLNSLQKQLVRELLEAEYPELQATPQDRGAWMNIFGRSNQDVILTKRAREQIVFKQVGARLLWDAICGQPFVANIERIQPRLLFGGPYSSFKVKQLRAELKQYEDRLQEKGPVVIGHNMLMDLCFLHTNFVNPVPWSLDEFRALTRERLPRIVDTKYLFTRGGDEMSPDYSLLECFDNVINEELPVVTPEPSHSYSKPCLHQAGYDSYMTAVVFLKKSYQLSQAGEGLQYIASEDLGEGEAMRAAPPTLALPPTPNAPKVLKPPPGFRAKTPSLHQPDSRTGNFLEDRDKDEEAALAKYGSMQPKRYPTEPATAPQTPDQSHHHMLQDSPQDTFNMGSLSMSESPATAIPVPGTVPEWDGQFWSKYGNRTRIGQFRHILYFGRKAGE